MTALARAAAAVGVVASGSLGAVACTGSDERSEPRTGAAIYREVCQTCHGRDGEGFVGPSLVDVADRFPDVADEIAIVANGAGQMPGFGQRLTTREIERVVEYTRTEFATHPAPTSSTAPAAGPTAGPTLPDTAS